MGKKFAASLRFKGTLTAEYKNIVIHALTGEPKPSWLKVVHLRTNSTGHTIRLSCDGKHEQSTRVFNTLLSLVRQSVPCGDGIVTVSSISFHIPGH